MAKTLQNNIYLPLLSQTAGAKIYADLRNQAIQLGYLKPNYLYYFLLALLNFVLLTFSLFFLFQANIWWQIILSSCAVSFFLVQIGGLTHDLGHHQVFKSTKLNIFIGYLIGCFAAIPFRVWIKNHNAHHAHTNEQSSDPDLESFFTFVSDRPDNKSGFRGLIRRHQHLFYYPLTTLASFSFRIKGMYHLLHDYTPTPLIDVILLSIGILLWWVVPFFVFPVPKALLFFFVGNLFGGFYLAHIFAPNHKGMPQLQKGHQYSFFEHQVITSRNVSGNFFIDYLLLGLNYQIEHHLFPAAPRSSLSKLHQLIYPICQKHQLPFVSMGLLETNKFLISELKLIASHT